MYPTGDWSISTKLSLTYYNLATQYFNEAKYADCKLQMEGAVELNSRVAEYFSLKGKAEYYLGQYDEAYADFKEALRLNPHDKDLQLRMMQFEKERGVDLPHSSEPERRSRAAAATIAGEGQGRREKHLPRKVKLQPSAVNISSDPLGLSDDMYKVASQEELNAPLEVSYCSALLPTLNPYMAAPMMASALAKKKKQRVQEITHSRTSMERGTLWKVVENISRQAAKQREPLINKEKTQAGKVMPKSAVTPLALKKLSEQISREAAKKPLLLGIKSSHDDPVLATLKTGMKAGSILKMTRLENMKKSASMPRVRIVSHEYGNCRRAANGSVREDVRYSSHSR